MPKPPPITLAKAQKALAWGLQHFAMGGNTWKVTLWFSDDEPSWSTGTSGGGTAEVSVPYHKISIWVGPTQCRLNDRDPLQTLFHELGHAILEAADLPHTGNVAEFMLDRQADALAYAYRKGMKPWK